MKRIALSILVLISIAPVAHAQFGLDRLRDNLNKAKSKADEIGGKAKQVEAKAKEVGKVAKGVAGIGPEEERVIGGSVALEIIGTYGGLWRDEAATRRINLVGKALARYSARPEHAWRFGILNSETVNGFSAPDGYVFITRKLYESLESDDALAAVLAHEIAHVTERHALNIVARGEFISGASKLVAERSSDVRAVEAQLREFDVGIEQITRTLFERGFDPQTEYEADRKGRELAVLTGYAPGALRAVLLQLKAQQRQAKSGQVFSTHPPIDQRVKRLPPDPN